MGAEGFAMVEDLARCSGHPLSSIPVGVLRPVRRPRRVQHRGTATAAPTAAERAEVAFHPPEVRCYAHEQVLALPDIPEFTPATVTEGSRQRRRMYQAGFRRTAEQSAFTGPDEDFLRSLELVMRISSASADDLARIEEPTPRTSQMNATGVHCSDTYCASCAPTPRTASW